jgi:ubiquinone/menaquinone biosynthesis C-methylase UbiE
MLQKVNDPTLTSIQGNVTVFPMKDETFTLAILINTMHHIDKNKQSLVLREVLRILKKQGRIYIIDIWFPDTFLSNLFVRIEKLLVGTTFHLTAEEMKTALQKAGFRDISVFFPKKNPYRYVTVGIK